MEQEIGIEIDRLLIEGADVIRAGEHARSVAHGAACGLEDRPARRG